MVDEAVAAGAALLAGGKRVHGARGQYFEPTVLRNLDPAARIMHEELFGPVMLLQRVRDDAEAVRIANASAFGLSSSVMSRDARRARRIAEQLVAGSTCINDFGLCYMVQDLPFGGVKHSGFGRLNARDGLRAFTNVKSVLADRLPLHRANRLFPVGAADYELARGAIRLIYGRGFTAKAAALVELARARCRRAPRDA
jgi:acyl-CoA reductase-like NAD-dependent aldehyde dehydrogenase